MTVTKRFDGCSARQETLHGDRVASDTKLYNAHIYTRLRSFSNATSAPIYAQIGEAAARSVPPLMQVFVGCRQNFLGSY